MAPSRGTLFCQRALRQAILVFDMPGFKRLALRRGAPCSNAAEILPQCDQRAEQKQKAPKIGAICRKYNFGQRRETKAASLQALDSQALETEVRNVAIPYGDAGAGHQQAVNDGHQAAEYSG
jgi:hypothetical protein